MSDAILDYVSELEKLWDIVSDMVESGRLTQAHIPDDYEAIVEQMSTLAPLRATFDEGPLGHEQEEETKDDS